MSYGRMEARATQLEAEVSKWLAAAEAADAEEDKIYGDKQGDELPAWVADKQKRAEKIRAAKAELEAEAKAAAEAKAKAEAEAEEKRKAEGRKKPGKPAAPPSPEPDPKAQKNFTDPESRIRKGKDGFVPAFNGQIAVDAQAQIIVAQDVTQCAADKGQLIPMVDAVEANLGRKPEQASADSGYCSEANLEGMESRNIDAYVATGRAKHATADEAKDDAAATTANAAAAPISTQEADAPTRVEAMRSKIKSGGYESPYRLRKQLPEPVFGQIKEGRGFRQFLMRGIVKVRAEWALVCTAHNLLKLARGRSLSAARKMAYEAGLAFV
jgi:septal ring factor EnvC (AmiA/AmiB activator)